MKLDPGIGPGHWQTAPDRSWGCPASRRTSAADCSGQLLWSAYCQQGRQIGSTAWGVLPELVSSIAQLTGDLFMSEVQQLYRLQEIDTEIKEKKQRLGEVLKAQRETEALLAARQRAATAEQELKKWGALHIDLNLELDGLVNKAKRSENRLYSGQVTNPKELTDLQNEIASLGRRRLALEDEILEAMIMIEDAEAEQSTADASLSRIETEWERSQAELKNQQNELAMRLHGLNTMRQEQLPLISSGALTKYENIGQRHNGLAVVLLRGNMCQGCQLNVSANTVKEVNQGKMVYCDICGRILTHPW
jgi:predicted  nucleic acid-binding Zn-ribbon protein